MAEPEGHTLRLLREFRQEFADYRKEFSEFRRSTDERFDRSDERFDELTRLFAGESVLGRYAAGDVEKRLASLEQRVAAMERQK